MLGRVKLDPSRERRYRWRRDSRPPKRFGGLSSHILPSPQHRQHLRIKILLLQHLQSTGRQVSSRLAS